MKHSDDRGFLLSWSGTMRISLSILGRPSWSKSYPGVIKAFHYHEKQDDLWFFPTGHAQVVLYDLREDSKTKGETDVYYMGEDNP
ncbi:spore coat protein, partial [Micromonospora provocatoris]